MEIKISKNKIETERKFVPFIWCWRKSASSAIYNIFSHCGATIIFKEPW